MAKKIQCPNWKCKSVECVPVSDGKKYSAGKGIVGGAIGASLLGPVGLIAGAASGFNRHKKVKFMCTKCGTVFEEKI